MTHSTNTWVRRFESWYSQQPCQQTQLEEIPVQEFYCHVHKLNGDEYEPDSLHSLDSNSTKGSGKGKKSRKIDSLTAEEEAIVWNTGVFGSNNPKSLNHTVFYVISQHFGTRGCQQHHQIRVEHLWFVCNAQSGATKFIKWKEGLKNTPTGRLG